MTRPSDLLWIMAGVAVVVSSNKVSNRGLALETAAASDSFNILETSVAGSFGVVARPAGTKARAEQQPHAEPNPEFERVREGTIDGVILPPLTGPTDQPVQWWRPTRSEVLEVEGHIPSFLRHRLGNTTPKITEGLAQYKRQYTGFWKDGRRLLAISFFHESSRGVREGIWLRVHLSVAGGGDNYFRIWYDVKKKEFYYFSVNAPA